ncbi:hypothetical protein [Cetobacterium sp.]|uniref:hypothetical protein n=1 Tax=Cetobacterium sp. TaxID=2071632 RepID=UPI003F327CCA
MARKTLSGFLLTIEDNSPIAETLPVQTDIYMIYAVLPDTMKYEDEEGNIYDKYIEPNTPLIVANAERNEAIKTLELSDIELTREVRNMISIIPNDVNISLCRIVMRSGDSPDPNNLIEMYEALDFAFEETENLPIKEIYCAGISLDKAVGIKPNTLTKRVLEKSNVEIENTEEFVTDVTSLTGSNLIASKMTELKVLVEKAGDSLTQEGGVYNKLTLYLGGSVAKIRKGTELIDYVVTCNVDYTNPQTPGFTNVLAPEGVTATFAIASQKMVITLSGAVDLYLDETTVVKVNSLAINTANLGKTPADIANPTFVRTYVAKTSVDADILTRILNHNKVITATQNNCLTFMSPEPPRNQSKKAIEEYVNRSVELAGKVRARTLSTINGKKVDMGMYLSVVTGVNKLGDIGGLYGFYQSTIATTNANKVITKKATSLFEVGDLVEVYSHDKLDILYISAKVTDVRISDNDTTEITLDKEIPSNIMQTTTPKYIANVNNKDFNGTYMAIQYSNICKQVGVNRSPAGIVWNGECQLKFSAKQIDLMDAEKLCVLSLRNGTTQGEVSKSQLMTGITSQFQDYENIATVYSLASGCKTIGMKYKGERLKESTDLALIKNEIETTVFIPATNKYIYPGYDLKLTTKKLVNPNGKKERALFIDFTVTEIETMKLLRITARIN